MSIEISSAGGKIEIEAISDPSQNIISDLTWGEFTEYVTLNDHTIIFEKNEDGKDRNALINFKITTKETSGYRGQDIDWFSDMEQDDEKRRVKQYGKGSISYVSINPDTINIPALGTVQTATVYSNTSWNISSTKPSWLWISKTSGGPNESGENIQFSAATHTTTGTSSTTITLTGTMGGSATATVNRMSDTPYVTPSISKNTVGSEATSVTITINSNTDWTISSDSSWATLSQTAGTGNASITVTVDENTLTSSRSATFTVGSTSCTPSPSTLELTQDGK